MIDFYFSLRQRMIETMQKSLKQVRQVLGFGVQEFSDIVGLTRQTINNLETNKSKMSAVQYVAICAMIDHFTEDKQELLQVLSTILSSNDLSEEGNIFSSVENNSFLKKWFSCFPDESKIAGITHEENIIIERNDFAGIAARYKIFLDETILCKKGFCDWVTDVAVTMKEYNNKFLVPLKVVEKIQENILSSDISIATDAQSGLNLLMRMQKDDLVEIRGEKSDINVISTFISVFAKFKFVNRLALLTQNFKLAERILSLNKDDLGGFNILVTKFDEKTGLIKWGEEENLSFMDNQAELEEESKIFTNSEILKGWETID